VVVDIYLELEQPKRISRVLGITEIQIGTINRFQQPWGCAIDPELEQSVAEQRKGGEGIEGI
jgi:hypothetical protein